MDEEWLPRKILEWGPPERRRKGRPRNSWMEEAKTGMREKGIKNMEWVDRRRRKMENKNKIKTLVQKNI